MECYPMTPSYVFAHHNGALSEYEKSEILEYSEIYYLGNQEKKLRVVAKEGERRSGDTISKHLVRNLGYDNERGDYNLVMFDHIAYRYEVLSVLGKGSFGIVVKVFDHKTQEMRALKIIRNLKRFHLQALVEGKILRHISERDPTGESNLIRVLDQFYFREHLCFTFRLFDINLYEWTRQRKYAGFALETVRVISKQILLVSDFVSYSPCSFMSLYRFPFFFFPFFPFLPSFFFARNSSFKVCPLTNLHPLSPHRPSGLTISPQRINNSLRHQTREHPPSPSTPSSPQDSSSFFFFSIVFAFVVL